MKMIKFLLMMMKSNSGGDDDDVDNDKPIWYAWGIIVVSVV